MQGPDGRLMPVQPPPLVGSHSLGGPMPVGPVGHPSHYRPPHMMMMMMPLPARGHPHPHHPRHHPGAAGVGAVGGPGMPLPLGPGGVPVPLHMQVPGGGPGGGHIPPPFMHRGLLVPRFNARTMHAPPPPVPPPTEFKGNARSGGFACTEPGCVDRSAHHNMVRVLTHYQLIHPGVHKQYYVVACFDTAAAMITAFYEMMRVVGGPVLRRSSMDIASTGIATVGWECPK